MQMSQKLLLTEKKNYKHFKISNWSSMKQNLNDNTATGLWDNIPGEAQSAPQTNSHGETCIVIPEFQPECG